MAVRIGPILDLEEQMQHDTNGSLRDRLTGEFVDATKRIKRTMDGGVLPTEFVILSKLVAAYDAAVTVVTTVWNSIHGNDTVQSRTVQSRFF
ncbi:MAG: hypothetical protein WCK65_10655 [Rhodospirillaceae bacterium]